MGSKTLNLFKQTGENFHSHTLAIATDDRLIRLAESIRRKVESCSPSKFRTESSGDFPVIFLDDASRINSERIDSEERLHVLGRTIFSKRKSIPEIRWNALQMAFSSLKEERLDDSAAGEKDWHVFIAKFHGSDAVMVLPGFEKDGNIKPLADHLKLLTLLDLESTDDANDEANLVRVCLCTGLKDVKTKECLKKAKTTLDDKTWRLLFPRQDYFCPESAAAKNRRRKDNEARGISRPWPAPTRLEL